MKKTLKNNSQNSTLKSTISSQKNESLFFDNLITVEDLACAFGVAPRTIRNWVSLREVPFCRIRGKTYFRRKSIEAWINRKEKPCR